MVEQFIKLKSWLANDHFFVNLRFRCNRDCIERVRSHRICFKFMSNSLFSVLIANDRTLFCNCCLHFLEQFIVLVDNTLFMDEDVNIKRRLNRHWLSADWLNAQTQNVITAQHRGEGIYLDLSKDCNDLMSIWINSWWVLFQLRKKKTEPKCNWDVSPWSALLTCPLYDIDSTLSK